MSLHWKSDKWLSPLWGAGKWLYVSGQADGDWSSFVEHRRVLRSGLDFLWKSALESAAAGEVPASHWPVAVGSLASAGANSKAQPSGSFGFRRFPVSSAQPSGSWAVPGPRPWAATPAAGLPSGGVPKIAGHPPVNMSDPWAPLVDANDAAASSGPPAKAKPRLNPPARPLADQPSSSAQPAPGQRQSDPPAKGPPAKKAPPPNPDEPSSSAQPALGQRWGAKESFPKKAPPVKAAQPAEPIFSEGFARWGREVPRSSNEVPAAVPAAVPKPRGSAAPGQLRFLPPGHWLSDRPWVGQDGEQLGWRRVVRNRRGAGYQQLHAAEPACIPCVFGSTMGINYPWGHDPARRDRDATAQQLLTMDNLGCSSLMGLQQP